MKNRDQDRKSSSCRFGSGIYPDPSSSREQNGGEIGLTGSLDFQPIRLFDSDPLVRERPTVGSTLSNWVGAAISGIDSAATRHKLDTELRDIEAEHRQDMRRLNNNIERATTELQARNRLLALADEAATRERVLQIKQAARQLGPGQDCDRIEFAIDTEKVLTELDKVRSPAALPPAPQAPALQQHYDAQEVEKIAVRAFNRIGANGYSGEAAAWSRFEQDITNRLPSLAANAVINRTRELRGLAR